MRQWILKNKNFLLTSLSLIAAAAFWLAGLYFGKYLMNDIRGVSVMSDSELFTSVQAGELQASEKEKGKSTELTAWVKTAETEVHNEGRNASFRADLYNVFGSLREVFPAEYICGSPLLDSDEKGCVISSVLSYELFGSSQTAGLSLMVNDKEYYVRGVFDENEPIIMLRAGEDDSFTNLELIFPDESDTTRCARSFLLSNGIYQDTFMIDNNFAGSFIRIFYMLPIWIVSAVLILKAFKFSFSLRGSYLLLGISLAMSLILAALLIWITGFGIVLPESMFPSKWSDFNFYSALFKQIKEGLYEAKINSPTLKQLALRELLQKTVLCSFISSAITIVGMVMIKKEILLRRGIKH